MPFYRGNSPEDEPTGAAHIEGLQLNGSTTKGIMPITCFVFLRRFREDPKWHFLQWWTLSAGIIITIGVVLLSIATKVPALQKSFIDWLGLIQRTAIVPYMIWLFTFALGVYRRSNKS